jgi:uncharacterized integral membrane protein (TIGR00698 family)
MTERSAYSIPLGADLYGDLLEPEARPEKGIKAFLPGLAMAGVAALAAAWLSEHYGAPLMLMGLLLGLSFNFTNQDERLHPGLGFASKTLLRLGIVLLGFRITIWQMAELGWAGFGAIALILGLVLGSGVVSARRFRLDSAFGVLAGGAVAICGASAALALAGVLGEKRVSQAQLTIVLVAIAAASAIAMPLYPLIGTALGYSDQQIGFLSGAAIHDVAQALGAGYSHSEAAGATATIVKLTRVALLAPTLTLVALAFPTDETDKGKGVPIPWFVVAFLGVALLNSFAPLPKAFTAGAGQAATGLLVLAVTATGIRSPMQMMMTMGWRSAVPVIVSSVVALLLALTAAKSLF